MGLDRFPDEAIGLRSTVNIAQGVTLGVNQQRVRVTATAAGNVTLPPVAEAKGKFYSVIVKNGVTYTVTVIDQGDSEIAVSDAHSTDNAVALYYSDGSNWFLVL